MDDKTWGSSPTPASYEVPPERLSVTTWQLLNWANSSLSDEKRPPGDQSRLSLSHTVPHSSEVKARRSGQSVHTGQVMAQAQATAGRREEASGLTF